MLPEAGGLILQVTAVFQAPETLAANCRFAEGPRVIPVGETETVTVGVSVIVAVPIAPLAALVAVIVTILDAKIVGGAV